MTQRGGFHSDLTLRRGRGSSLMRRLLFLDSLKSPSGRAAAQLLRSAAMDSPAPEEDFSCSICLELFKVPLSLSCGHSFCKSCIESHWAVQSEETGFSCPECRRVYYRKPELSKNVFIANMMEILTEIPISPRAGTNSPRAGINSPRAGINSPRAGINSPRGGRRCEPHGQGLELYCRTDAQLICPGCTSCHRRHDIVPVQTEQEDKSEELSSMKLRLSKREGSEISFVNDLVDSTKTVEAAAEQIKWRLSSSYDKLLYLVSEDKASALRAVDKERDLKLSGIRQEIEKSRATLGSLREALSRIRGLEETEDPVEFLEGCTLHWESFASLECEQMEPTGPSTLLEFETTAALQEQIDERLLSFRTSALTNPPQPKPTTPRGRLPAVARHGLDRAKLISRYGCSPTFDTNSAHNLLQISPDLRMVAVTRDSQRHPNHPLRFEFCPQVLCCESFSSGQHYWEVDLGNKSQWCWVGAAYGTIPRKGDNAACTLGMGDESWCLKKDGTRFSVSHGGVEIPVEVREPLRRVGVLLHWEEGLLEFYRADSMQSLHAIHYRFTLPLHPALGVGGDSMRIIDLSCES
uniref:Tripartite motif-containing protein 14-like n=1 Tax=Petromyzon marinus TaxID=7757 RepID=A0AAJ7UGP9_PETMA|nr:tripartite motif-containing protein 14-like [Petromyzon marinus]